ncbi:MAG: hypothetical protein RML93_13150 [Anaerolineales bacterium]|nr:hypothetical protein [Anaerolineales bacterium]MCS7246745.1 hypothetical protein [Anaerolineales bacterium]MDW8160555.1 hypothetical protein [Anaerolineales bacterium]MDW8448220.1 hypothetical protein [Anaerolineales bacterium]
MKVIFLFLDGVGIGSPDPCRNPFLEAKTPFLDFLLQGRKLCQGLQPFHSDLVSFYALDACMEVPGLPQSATGQAAILTGKNLARQLGYHFGPKPNPEIAHHLKNSNLFHTLRQRNYRVSYLNAFPPIYFENIASGKRLFSAIPLAAASAGLDLKGYDELMAGEALSADFTAEGWHIHLGIQGVPLLSPKDAGKRIAQLAQNFDLIFFEHWLTDYAGHRQNKVEAIRLLEVIDAVLEGLLRHWSPDEGIIWVTSDHGNIEDLSHRRHTQNQVPLLLVGSLGLREKLPALQSLLDIYPALLSLFP